MKRGLGAAAVAMLLSSCSEEPGPKGADTAASAIEVEANKNAVEKRQLSIEEAAEEATKLIEADAKAEVDAAAAEDTAG